MNSVNKVMLLGNLTRDPQIRYTQSQKAVADFGLALNRKYKSGNGEMVNDVCFIDCTVWENQAKLVEKYLKKGDPIFVEGSLKRDTWEDKNGNKREKISVHVEKLTLLTGKKDKGEQEMQPATPDDIPAF